MFEWFTYVVRNDCFPFTPPYFISHAIITGASNPGLLMHAAQFPYGDVLPLGCPKFGQIVDRVSEAHFLVSLSRETSREKLLQMGHYLPIRFRYVGLRGGGMERRGGEFFYKVSEIIRHNF